MSDLFPVMFADSPAAAKYQLRYSINFGLGLFFNKNLCRMFKTNYYSLSFDESFNRLTQSSEMDLIVSYLYHSDYLVKTRYVSWVMLDIMICIKTSSPLLKGWMRGNY